MKRPRHSVKGPALRDIPGLPDVLLDYAEAAYTAHALESALINVSVALELADRGASLASLQDLSALSPDVVVQLREQVEILDERTLGQLLKRVRQRLTLDAGTDSLLGRALERRNYLVHHFFFKHTFDLYLPQGHYEMKKELAELHDLFEHAYAVASQLNKALWKLVGMKEDQWREDTVAFLSQE
jgi:hypothetical protein